ncbi:MAG: S1 RNA-binding domain-containing protein [Anaerolineae bacterium]|nr:S1 RNA-binding domain-containing protein [Anaerolineae bacterium]
MVPEKLEGGNEDSADLQVDEVLPAITPPFAAASGEDAAESAEPEAAGPAEEEAPAEPELPSSAMGEEVLEQYDYELPKRGEVRKGTVISVQQTEIVVDIGAKRECAIATSDVQKLGGDVAASIREGSEVSVYIVKPGDREGHLVGSLYLAEIENEWARAEEMEQSGEVFEARVTGQNRGGLLVPFGRLRGFVPASHLVGTNSTGQPVVLSHWIGKTLPFKIIEANRRRNRLIFSYRAARRQWRAQQKQSLLDGLREGDVRRGIVSSLASFGAFVDLGGADGLIHVSELAWYRVEHPSEVLQVGQEVEVYVLRVEGERGRIGLSLKRLQPDPWTLVEEKYLPDQNVEGTITKLVDFGAFAELEKGIEGLIHITELADPVPARPEDVVRPGEVHLLRVLRADARSRRIGLSLKAVDPQELQAWEAARAAQSMRGAGPVVSADAQEPPAEGQAEELPAEGQAEELEE